jgi:predicted small secreted protein
LKHDSHVEEAKDAMMKKLITLICSMMLLVGCNTIEGMGRDIKKGGEVIEKTAEKTAEKLKK